MLKIGVIAPTYAVAGNNDGYEIYTQYGMRRIIEAGGKRKTR